MKNTLAIYVNKCTLDEIVVGMFFCLFKTYIRYFSNDVYTFASYVYTYYCQ